MYVKLFLGNLNPDLYPLHLTITYIYKVTIPSRCAILEILLVELTRTHNFELIGLIPCVTKNF